MKVTKRCGICGRFRSYDPDDGYCIGCGNDALHAECGCGRSFDFALDEAGDMHCPRCGRALRGRTADFTP